MSLDLSKHNRSVPIHCPTCGATEFSVSDAEESDTALVKCPGCGLEISRADLLAVNQENIQINAKELAKAALPDLEKHLKKQLQDAFKGNKFIKFK